MKRHTRIYMNHFGYDVSSFISCECCGQQAIDIHHIEARGMGGSKTKDVIENLIALCREHHLLYGDKVQYKSFLKGLHKIKLKNHKP